MRKVLYSPGYGAGWVSWYSGSTEEKQFMLTYQPFIDFLENGGQFPDRDQDSENLEIVKQFIVDFKNRFPNADIPYFGGLRDLEVECVEGAVQIKEYDGSESVRISSKEWL